MTTEQIILEMFMDRTYKVVFVEYPKRGNSGGWSSKAKHKPHPIRVEIITKDVKIFLKQKSVFVDGKRKIKCNIYNAETGQVIRADYSTTDELTCF